MPTQVAEPELQPETPQDDPTSLIPKKLAGRVRCSIRRSSDGPTKASFVKLNPVTLVKNPVMFVVEVGAALTTFF